MAVPSHQKTSDALLREWLEIILNGADRRVSVQETRCGFREMQQGTSFEHPFLNLGSGPQTDGLCVFADSDVVVRSAENMTRFSARLGFDYNKTTVWAEEIEARVRLVFSVEVKGKELWRSQELDLRREESVDLPLPPETKEMVLKVRTAGGTAYAHGLWAGATVDLAGGERIKIGKKLYPEIPFSFVYDGHPSGELLSGWKKTRTSRPGKKKGVTEHILTWTDPKSALECRMELSEFADYPALEWVLYFRNGGKSDTAILENVQALDVSWKVQPREFENLEARVYRSRGSVFHLSDYEYVEERLLNTETIEMSAGAWGRREAAPRPPGFPSSTPTSATRGSSPPSAGAASGPAGWTIPARATSASPPGWKRPGSSFIPGRKSGPRASCSFSGRRTGWPATICCAVSSSTIIPRASTASRSPGRSPRPTGAG